MRFDAKLEAYGPLSAEARRALIALLKPSRSFRRGATLQNEGDPTVTAFVIVEGLAQSRRSMGDAAQQTLAFHLAGDIVGLPAILSGRSADGLAALTRVTAAQIDADALLALTERHPALGRLFARDIARDVVIAQEWMVGLGRRSAYARTAHLMCEIFVRHAAIEAIGEAQCPFPLNQGEIADALGLSIVHVNRVLQRLRSEGLIALAYGRLTIRDWSALAEAAQFNPAYLAPFGEVPAMPLPSEPAP